MDNFFDRRLTKLVACFLVFLLLKMRVQVILLLALLGLASCQLALLNPAGRGFSFHDARHAPCGQSPTEVGDRVAWEQGTAKVY